MNSIFKNFRVITLIAALLCSMTIFAQDRQRLRNDIQRWGQCRTVALSATSGSVAIYSGNGFSAVKIPSNMMNALKEIQAEESTITDIHITDGGSWLILVDGNGYVGEGIPEDLDKVLMMYHDDDEAIRCATFNDSGEWIAISDSRYATSGGELNDWMVQGCKNYGMPTSVCLTEDAGVAVFQNGYIAYGEIPEHLSNALDSPKFDYQIVKISYDSWFMSDGNSVCTYEM